MEIKAIADRLNHYSKSFNIGSLQQIRRKIKNLAHAPSSSIFTDQSIQENYAFHLGGRTELQFNIGLERIGGTQYLRHGVAFSLETSKTLPSIDPLVPKIALFNEFIRIYPDELSNFRMWHFVGDTRSSTYRVSEIPPEQVRSNVFIFIGQLGSAEKPDYDRILSDFDKLLALYYFVEGQETFPRLNTGKTAFKFSSDYLKKPSSAVASLPAKTLDLNLRHNVIQDSLRNYLINEYGEKSVGTEIINGNASRVDVVVKSGKGYHFYEIKTSQSARGCIREALSQLLEYSYWPGVQEAKKLIIVGEPELDKDAREYLTILRDRFLLPICYKQFNVSEQSLVE